MKNVRICNTKITPCNLLSFLQGYDVPKEFGVLSLDIDSYDYFVLETLLTKYRPTVLMVEINEKIPPPLSFTVTYDETWGWDGSHFYGMSISQAEKLAHAHNYALVHLEYNNLFLVAGEHHFLESLSATEAYNKGYLSKADRKEKYPWNQDMEELLTLPPQEGMEFLHERFACYKGKYLLSHPIKPVEPFC